MSGVTSMLVWPGHRAIRRAPSPITRCNLWAGVVVIAMTVRLVAGAGIEPAEGEGMNLAWDRPSLRFG